jgi:hypothetical protein
MQADPCHVVDELAKTVTASLGNGWVRVTSAMPALTPEETAELEAVKFTVSSLPLPIHHRSFTFDIAVLKASKLKLKEYPTMAMTTERLNRIKEMHAEFVKLGFTDDSPISHVGELIAEVERLRGMEENRKRVHEAAVKGFNDTGYPK